MGKLIMVADDDEAIVTLCTELLVDEGYTMVSGVGEKALSVIFAQLPALVLLDLAMPGMDGTEIAIAMRAHEATRAIPIVVMTAFRHPKQWFNELDIDSYLLKPWSVEALLSAVRTYVEP